MAKNSDLTSTPRTLAALLTQRGVDPIGALAHRNDLHGQDIGAGAESIATLARSRHDLVYERMQDGLVFGAEARILSFIAEPDGRARFSGYRRLVARRAGVAPGDIIYDYDVAHLLHDFIARAQNPIFYDAFALPGLDDLVGALVLQWPAPLTMRQRPADDPALAMVEP